MVLFIINIYAYRCLLSDLVETLVEMCDTGFANFVDNNRKLFSKINAICLSLVRYEMLVSRNFYTP